MALLADDDRHYMDLITQGLLGAAVAQSGMKHKEAKLATVTGFVAGLIADADILIRSSTDSLLTIEYHRHFTHSVFFIPFGALLAAMLCLVFVRGRLTFKRLYYYCFFGFMLSGVLDAFTSYGTHLFWPLSNERIAWNLIAIVDPVFTLALLAGVIISFRTGQTKAARLALGFCSLYLMLGAFQLHRAEQQMQSLAASRGHQIETYIVKPTIANIVLWRSVYLAGDEYHIDAIRVGLAETKVYSGTHIRKANIETDFPQFDRDGVQFADIKRFQHFSSDFLALDPGQENVLGDVRYSVSPTSERPLWGIVLDPDRQDEHASYTFFREVDSAARQRFIDMLLGREID